MSTALLTTDFNTDISFLKNKKLVTKEINTVELIVHITCTFTYL